MYDAYSTVWHFVRRINTRCKTMHSTVRIVRSTCNSSEPVEWASRSPDLSLINCLFWEVCKVPRLLRKDKRSWASNPTNFHCVCLNKRWLQPLWKRSSWISLPSQHLFCLRWCPFWRSIVLFCSFSLFCIQLM